MKQIQIKLKYWALPLLVILGVMLIFRSGAFSSDKNKAAVPAGPSIKTAAASYVSRVPGLALNGSIEGKTSALVSAKLAGRIEQVLVQEGQAVKAGQPLLSLERVELSNSVDTAQDGITRAQVNYELAKRDYQRYQTLFAQGAIAQQTLDTAAAKLQIAQADLSSAVTSQRNARQQLDYGVITAPVDGVVANLTATVGQVVAAGSTLLAVQDISQVYAVVNIEQKDLGMIKSGQAANVSVDTFAGRVFAGTVETINPEAGSSSRMFRTKVLLSNPDGALKAGMYAKVQLTTGSSLEVLTVPQSAVLQKQGLYYVFVIKDGKAVRQLVEIGAVAGDTIEITNGLTAGTNVAVSNVSQLKDGETVRSAE